LDPPVVDALSMLLVRKWLEVDRFSEEEEEVENSGTLTSGVIASSWPQNQGARQRWPQKAKRETIFSLSETWNSVDEMRYSCPREEGERGAGNLTTNTLAETQWWEEKNEREREREEEIDV
jgi:hypothetical protein